MGYKITCLVNLPYEKNVKMYIFPIGKSKWENDLSKYLHRNFDNLAREIGPNAIIVGALEEEFYDEVISTYLGVTFEEIDKLIPALLITNSHPSKINEKSLIFLIPLNDVKGSYQYFDDFLNDLVAYVKGDNHGLIQRLDTAPKFKDIMNDLIKVSLPIVPGIVSLNLNNAVKQVINAWDVKKD